MTPQQFIAKWRSVQLSERSAYQQHFLDLCDLLGQDKPAAADPDGSWYTFERGCRKLGGEQGWADVWLKTLQFPGSIDGPWKRYVTAPDARGIGTVLYPRTVPRDEDCAKKLAKRTLTNLYNERPTWLDLAHRALDSAVAAAYAWPHDLPDDEILGKLLKLKLERAVAQC